MNALIRAFKTVNVNDPNSVEFETLPNAPDPSNPSVTLVPGPGAEALIDRLRTFGDNTPRLPAVFPSQVQVRVLDGSGTGQQDAVSKALEVQGFRSAGTGVDPRKHIHGTEIHYTPAEAPAAKALLAYIPDATLVPDWSLSSTIVLVIGETFTGIITPTPTTAAPLTSATLRGEEATPGGADHADDAAPEPGLRLTRLLARSLRRRIPAPRSLAPLLAPRTIDSP